MSVAPKTGRVKPTVTGLERMRVGTRITNILQRRPHAFYNADLAGLMRRDAAGCTDPAGRCTSRRNGPTPLPTAARPLDDDRFADPDPWADAGAAHQDYARLHRAERRDERRRRAPPGDPATDAGFGRLHP